MNTLYLRKTQCRNCGSDISEMQTKLGRPREYCGDSCRAAVFRRNKQVRLTFDKLVEQGLIYKASSLQVEHQRSLETEVGWFEETASGDLVVVQRQAF